MLKEYLRVYGLGEKTGTLPVETVSQKKEVVNAEKTINLQR